jgi:hypothetical protein
VAATTAGAAMTAEGVATAEAVATTAAVVVAGVRDKADRAVADKAAAVASRTGAKAAADKEKNVKGELRRANIGWDKEASSAAANPYALR